MAWSSTKPDEGKWNPQALYGFLRELWYRPKFGSFTWNPPNVPAASTVDTTLTTADSELLTGLRTGQAVTVTAPATLEAGLVVGAAWVAANDTLTIRIGNVTALDINPASGTWAFSGIVL